MIGELALTDECYYDENMFELGISVHDFCLQIYVDDEHPFEKQLKNRK